MSANKLYPAKYTPPANPVEALPADKKELFKKLRETVNTWLPTLAQEEQDHLTDLTLYRYRTHIKFTPFLYAIMLTSFFVTNIF